MTIASARTTSSISPSIAARSSDAERTIIKPLKIKAGMSNAAL